MIHYLVVAYQHRLGSCASSALSGVSLSIFSKSANDEGDQGSPICKYAGRLKRGVWGGIKVRLFKVHSRKKSSGLWHVCLPSTRRPVRFVFRGVSQRLAEILPVQRPPTLAVGRCVMRLTRILVLPFFSLSIMDQLPLHRGAFQNAQKTSLETAGGYTRLTGQST